MVKVFVSGCYDMLHSGHVAFFEEAASHGDLYVGLGSDQTIWGLKARKTINNRNKKLIEKLKISGIFSINIIRENKPPAKDAVKNLVVLCLAEKKTETALRSR